MPIPFDTVGVGPNNPITSGGQAVVVARFPLNVTAQITAVQAVFGATAGSAVSINVAYFAGNETVALTGTVPANGAYATPGQTVWAAPQALSMTPGNLNPLAVPSPFANYPAGGELALLVSTGAAGVGGLKVVGQDAEDQIIGDTATLLAIAGAIKSVRMTIVDGNGVSYDRQEAILVALQALLQILAGGVPSSIVLPKALPAGLTDSAVTRFCPNGSIAVT